MYLVQGSILVGELYSLMLVLRSEVHGSGMSTYPGYFDIPNVNIPKMWFTMIEYNTEFCINYMIETRDMTLFNQILKDCVSTSYTIYLPPIFHNFPLSYRLDQTSIIRSLFLPLTTQVIGQIVFDYLKNRNITHYWAIKVPEMMAINITFYVSELTYHEKIMTYVLKLKHSNDFLYSKTICATLIPVSIYSRENTMLVKYISLYSHAFSATFQAMDKNILFSKFSHIGNLYCPQHLYGISNHYVISPDHPHSLKHKTIWQNYFWRIKVEYYQKLSGTLKPKWIWNQTFVYLYNGPGYMSPIIPRL